MSRRLLGAAVGLVLATGLAIYGVNGLTRVRHLQREIATLEQDIAALRAQSERLTQTIDRLRNDPSYIEKLAREEHGLVREGEMVLKFPPRAR